MTWASSIISGLTILLKFWFLQLGLFCTRCPIWHHPPIFSFSFAKSIVSPSFSPPVTSLWTPHLQSLVSIQVFTLPVSSKLFEPPTPIFIILRLSCWASLLQSSCSQLHTKFFPSPFFFTSFKQRISSSINAARVQEDTPINTFPCKRPVVGLCSSDATLLSNLPL